jgi:hypothetical protein
MALAVVNICLILTGFLGIWSGTGSWELAIGLVALAGWLRPDPWRER